MNFYPKSVLRYGVAVGVLVAMIGCQGPLQPTDEHNPYDDEQNASSESARLNQQELYITDTPQIVEDESGDTRLEYSNPSPSDYGTPPPPDDYGP
ncbi:hypothetical protein [Poriferisphaera sp. WC338]|uniref:hypothetical protein n=1 Tax=Poriferisphaera sp. WC338 TaxID=3425129 RepID=UPI003D8183EF